MRKLTVLLIAAAILFTLAGCKENKTPPTADMEAEYSECWSGTVTDILTEGGGQDLAEVIALEIKDHGTMYFTVAEDTEYRRYYADTKETEEIEKEDICTGDWAEIVCTSYTSSDCHEIRSVTVIETTDPTGNNSIILKEPPVLNVICGEESIKAMKGSYSWEYDNGDGTFTGVEADSMHPLQAKEYMPSISLQPDGTTAAYLQFEFIPEAVSVRCWSGDCWEQYDAASEEAEVNALEADLEAGRFTTEYWVNLKDGDYIYEVTAKWNGFEKFSGTAYYSFYTVSAEIQESGK